MRLQVLLAAALVLVLGGLLTTRLIASTSRPGAVTMAATAPLADVPTPRAVRAADLEPPCWSCPQARTWPVTFRTDLDVLAPLGTGPANAAFWFGAFAKPDGRRFAEGKAAMARRVEAPDDWGLVLPADDPLLAEAAGWADQATMRFYPDVFPIEGLSTRIPNLLLMLTFARSWAAAGDAAQDPAQGLDDCRRAIRLGRLLRQEDAVIIDDLVGLASIHLGARGIYRIAARTGDLELALAASAVLGEVAPQRLFTAQRVTTVDLGSPLAPFLSRASSGESTLTLPETKMAEIVELATTTSGRRFQAEGLIHAGVVAAWGRDAQRRRARDLLETAAAGDDPILSAVARWCLAHPPTTEDLEQMFPSVH